MKCHSYWEWVKNTKCCWYNEFNQSYNTWLIAWVIWPIDVDILDRIPAVWIHPVVDTQHCITDRPFLYLSWIFDRPSLPGSMSCDVQSQIHRAFRGVLFMRPLMVLPENFLFCFCFIYRSVIKTWTVM